MITEKAEEMKRSICAAAVLVIVFLVAGNANCPAAGESESTALNIPAEEAAVDPQFCALFVADNISDIYYKPWMLSEVALTLVKTGREDKVAEILGKASVIAEGLDNPSYRADALMEVAGGYAEINRYREALAIAATIEATIPRVKTFCDIALKYAENGDEKRAFEVLEATLSGLGKKLGPVTDSALVELASAYISIGGYEDVSRIESEIKDPYFKVMILTDTANAHTASGKKGEALKLLERASVEAGYIQDEINTPLALSAAASGYAKAGKAEHALKILEGADKLTANIGSKYSKPEVLAGIVSGYIEADRPDLALGIAESMQDDNYKPRSLVGIAIKYGPTEPARSREILKMALEIAKLIRSPYSQASVMADIARGYLDIGDNETALDVIEDMRDDYNKPRSLAEIAMVFSLKGDKEKASGIFFQALEVASTISDNFYKSWALAEIAVKYSEAGMEPDDKAKAVLRRIVEDTAAGRG